MTASMTALAICEYLKDNHPGWVVEDGSGDFITICSTNHRNLSLYVDTHSNVVLYRYDFKNRYDFKKTGVVSTQPLFHFHSLPYTDNMVLDVISEVICIISEATPQ